MQAVKHQSFLAHPPFQLLIRLPRESNVLHLISSPLMTESPNARKRMPSMASYSHFPMLSTHVLMSSLALEIVAPRLSNEERNQPSKTDSNQHTKHNDSWPYLLMPWPGRIKFEARRRAREEWASLTRNKYKDHFIKGKQWVECHSLSLRFRLLMGRRPIVRQPYGSHNGRVRLYG